MISRGHVRRGVGSGFRGIAPAGGIDGRVDPRRATDQATFQAAERGQLANRNASQIDIAKILTMAGTGVLSAWAA